MEEEGVLDYLEEIASIELATISKDTQDDKILLNLPTVAHLGMYYLREGVSYLDIVQEGTLGLISALENYDEKIYGDFENYKRFWIIRGMIIFIHSKIEDIKNEFKSFFREKRERFNEETHIDVEDGSEVYLTEKDLLPTLESIDRREKMGDRIFKFEALKNRLSLRQIEVLKEYFGFEVERRFSIFEIEEKMELASGEGEKLFETAMVTLSTVKGKMFL